MKELQLKISPEIALIPDALEHYLRQTENIPAQDPLHCRILRRSIDARQKNIMVQLKVALYHNEEPPPRIDFQAEYPAVHKKPAVIIVGAGPAGLFAALRLIELGYKPIVLERGKDVQARRRDLADINKKHIVNPESNYCFGEGGAGTYSDGKLYTRSKKRGDIQRVLEILVAHGAVEDILYEAHPHIGTNKLPKIVAALRESIREAGGEVHFNAKVVDFILKDSQILGAITEDGQEWRGLGLILATGHSARDIFELLHHKGVLIENKPFALGFRIEHPQSMIDQIQYKRKNRGDLLPPSSYSLVSQVKYQGQERGVFSFCMCPGGFIVPSATAEGEIVVNGMSPSRRNSRFANSGIVVSVEENDLGDFRKMGPLGGLAFQKTIEQKACQLAGNTQLAPAQRMQDFINGKVSSQLLDTSYQPGLTSMDLKAIFPKFIHESLRQGLIHFGKKMRGYLSNEAQLVGVESRTSSPVRIPRDRVSGEHPQIKGLFPGGEGAGYAGGIMSAAMDGEKMAENLVKSLH